MQFLPSGAFLIAGRNPYLDRFGKEAKKAFFCKCGYREKLSDFNSRKASDGAGKYEVQRYMKNQQKKEEANNPFADLLNDWK